jgi:hypothetical protein
MKMRKFILLMVVTCALASCGVALKTKRPVLPTAPQPIPSTESYFNIPVKLNLTEISKMVSAQLPMQLYKEDGLDVGYGVKMNIEIDRRGPYTFSTVNGNLNMSVPLHINGIAKINSKLCSFCPKIEKTQPFSSDITLSTSSKLAIAPNWDLKTETSTDIHVDNPPKMNILGFDISLETITNKIIRSALPKLEPLINDKINHSYNLREKGEASLKQFSQPFLVLNNPVNIWLGVAPAEFNAAPPISLDSNKMMLAIGMKTNISTFVGVKPVLSNQLTLPPINSNPVREGLLATDIPVTVQLSDIINEARKELVGKTFTVTENRTVTINDIDLYGNGKTLVIRTNVTSKKIKGDLYILADPFYDKNSKMFKVENLKFDAQTNSILLNKAVWLASKLFINIIESKISYNAGKQLSDAQVKLDESLKNLSSNGILSLSAKITDFDVQNMFFDAAYAYFNLRVKGNINVEIK